MLKNLFKKNKDTEVYAPLSGDLVKLEDVPDPVFNQKMMGEGIAVKPTSEIVTSPINGEVIQLFDTKHAIGLKDEQENEIMIHIGLDTVKLKGEGFISKVTQGDKVTRGQELIHLDLHYLNKNAKDTITPVIVTNSIDNDKTIYFTNEKEVTAGETFLMKICES